VSSRRTPYRSNHANCRSVATYAGFRSVTRCRAWSMGTLSSAASEPSMMARGSLSKYFSRAAISLEEKGRLARRSQCGRASGDSSAVSLEFGSAIGGR
jgi:hypothetical protein